MSQTQESRTDSFFPLAGLATDGWSTAEEASATCYCGTVQLSVPITKPGLILSFVCHCSDCRKITASMFTSGFLVLDSHLKHIRGEENLTQFTQSETIKQEGLPMSNFFCRTCGTLMYRRSAGVPGASILRIGTVDNFKLAETALRPTIEQYVKHRVDWIKDIAGMVQFEALAGGEATAGKPTA